MKNPCKDCKVQKTTYIDKYGNRGFVQCQSCPTQKDVSVYAGELLAEIRGMLKVAVGRIRW